MKKRVLVVDDSAFMRKVITEILSESPDLTVVGSARDGVQALQMLQELSPDVVTLDIEMPTMSGDEALRRIMKEKPTPVVMLSSLTQAGAEITVKCLQEGALDYVAKPSGSTSLDILTMAEEIRSKVSNAARASVQSNSAGVERFTPVQIRTARPRLIIIGCSTGGPRALQALIPSLSGSLNVPIVVVQHMPEHFTKSLAGRLNSVSALTVREAQEGDRLQRGSVLIAPGGRHMVINGDMTVSLNSEPLVHGVRPAIDVSISSAVHVLCGEVGVVILTGMGRDGTAGCRAVRSKGGPTIAEHESTCAVYGMPRAVVEANAAEYVLPLPEIGAAIEVLCQPKALKKTA